MLVANRCKQAELGDAPEHMRGNIRATGVVAEILLEFLFMAIRSSEARLNSDPGHNKNLLGNADAMISIKGGPAQVTSGHHLSKLRNEHFESSLQASFWWDVRRDFRSSEKASICHRRPQSGGRSVRCSPTLCQNSSKVGSRANTVVSNQMVSTAEIRRSIPSDPRCLPISEPHSPNEVRPRRRRLCSCPQTEADTRCFRTAGRLIRSPSPPCTTVEACSPSIRLRPQ